MNQLRVLSEYGETLRPFAKMFFKKLNKPGSYQKTVYADKYAVARGRRIERGKYVFKIVTIYPAEVIAQTSEMQYPITMGSGTGILRTALKVGITGFSEAVPTPGNRTFRADRMQQLLYHAVCQYVIHMNDVDNKIHLYDWSLTTETPIVLNYPSHVETTQMFAEFSRLVYMKSMAYEFLAIPYLTTSYAAFGSGEFYYNTYLSSYITTIKQVFAPKITQAISANKSIPYSEQPHNANISGHPLSLQKYYQKPNIVNGETYYYPLNPTTLGTDVVKIEVKLPETPETEITFTETVVESIGSGGFYGPISTPPSSGGHMNLRSVLNPPALAWTQSVEMDYVRARKFGNKKAIYGYDFKAEIRTFLDRFISITGGTRYEDALTPMVLFLPGTEVTLNKTKKTDELKTTFKLSKPDSSTTITSMLPVIDYRIQKSYRAGFPFVGQFFPAGVGTILGHVMDIEHRTASLSALSVYHSDTTLPSADLIYTDNQLENEGSFYRSQPDALGSTSMEKMQTYYDVSLTGSVIFLPEPSIEPFIATYKDDPDRPSDNDAEVVCIAGYRITTYIASDGNKTFDEALTNKPAIYRASEPCVIVVGDTDKMPLEAECDWINNSGLDYKVLKPSAYGDDVKKRAATSTSYWTQTIDGEVIIEAQNRWTGTTDKNGMMLCLEPSCCAAQYSYWRVSKVMVKDQWQVDKPKIQLKYAENAPITDSGYSVKGTGIHIMGALNGLIDAKYITIRDLEYQMTLSTLFFTYQGSTSYEATHYYKMFVGDYANGGIYCGEVLIKAQNDIELYPIRVDLMLLKEQLAAVKVKEEKLGVKDLTSIQLIHPRIIKMHS